MKPLITIVLCFGSLSVSVTAENIDCNNAVTTIDINHCKGLEVEATESEMEKYLQTSIERYRSEPEVTKSLQDAHATWLTYREEYCHAQYIQWQGGTIRGFMYGECMLQLTRQHTHNLWRDYLTYMDSTPPLLPEPKVL